MSEPNSLYVKVHISASRRLKFLEQVPVSASLDTAWQIWWDTRQMYSKQPLVELPTYSARSNKAVLQNLLEDAATGSLDCYDAEKEEWIIVSLLFSENYVEILPMLSFLKSLETYVDPNAPGLALIYDYNWGSSSVMALMRFQQGQAQLTALTDTKNVCPDEMAQINQTMDAVVETFNRRFKD